MSETLDGLNSRPDAGHGTEIDLDLARTRLEQSEQNFNTFFNTIEDLIFVLDDKGGILFTNQSAIRKLGYTQEELSGMNVLQLHPPELRETAQDIVARMIEGTEKVCPLPLLKRDGTRFPVETRVVLGVWSGKNVLFGISKDITELTQANEKFRKAFYNNPSPMAISDMETGRYLEVNQSFLRLFDYAPHEVIGRSSAELRIFCDLEQRNRIRDKVRTFGHVEGEIAHVRKRMGQVAVGMFSGDVLSLQGKDYLLTLFYDLTDRFQFEDALKEAKREAEAANEAKSRFLSSMSHELRTPMNGILGFLNLLDGTALDETQRDYAAEIRRASSHMLSLINNILDLSKIESGKTEIEQTPFSLRAAVQEAFQLVAPAAERKSLRMSFTIDRSIPEMLLGDDFRLKQVLSNLLSNAVKFTDRGSVSLRAVLEPEAVRMPLQAGMEATGRRGMDAFTRKGLKDSVRAGADASIRLGMDASSRADSDGAAMKGAHLGAALPDDGCRIRIQVEDTGIGMTPEQIGVIFQPFSQADGTISRRYGGTGLGLSISRELARLMGGDLTVESRPGVGSIFTARMGFGIARAAAAEIPPDPAPAAVWTPSGLRVLVAEDNRTNQKLLVQMLSNLGIGSRIASNGLEAIDACRDEIFDLVFMDCQMPVLDGLAATRIIRESLDLDHQPHIVALTAGAMKGDRERCISAGMDEYVMKPFQIDEIVEVMKQLARKRQPDRLIDAKAGGGLDAPVQHEQAGAQAATQAGAQTGAQAATQAGAAHDDFQTAVREMEQTAGVPADAARNLILQYAESLQAELDRMRRSGSPTDAQELRSWLHRHRGAAANLRLKGMSRMMLEMEEGTPTQIAILSGIQPALLRFRRTFGGFHGD